jgi:hypothetical protein
LIDVATLQDEFSDGKQEQEDKNWVEFGAEKSADHEQFSLFAVWSCGFHDLRGGPTGRTTTHITLWLEPVPREI